MLAVALGGVAIGREAGGPRAIAGSGTAAAGSTTTGQFGFGTGPGRNPYGTYGSGTAGSTGTGTTRSATAAESVGVVDITTVLNYGQGAAAGTGIVLTADGEILTNNHVVADATTITVTVVSTGTSYRPRSWAPTPPTTWPCCSCPKLRG